MFSSIGKYSPTGIFTTAHLIAFAICFALVLICVYLSFDVKQEKLKPYYIFISSLMFIMLLVDIIWNLIEKFYSAESLIPLGIVLLFVLALWFKDSKNKLLSKICKSLVVYVGIGFGALMLIFTIPSFTNFPIFHFKCLFALLQYSLMLYCGISVLVHKEVQINAKTLKLTLFMMFDFVVDCLILNTLFNVNFLYLFSPKGLNVPILNQLYLFNGGLYSLTIFSALFVPVIIAFFICKIVNFLIKKYQEQREN